MTYVFILFVVGYSAISVGQRYDFSCNLTRPTQSPAARWECGALGGSIHYNIGAAYFSRASISAAFSSRHSR